MASNSNILDIKPVIAIFCLALLLRLIFFGTIAIKNPPGFFEVDSHGYWKIADNLLKSQTFSLSETAPLHADHSRTPLYPLFLAGIRALGLKATGIILIQIMFSAITCIVVIMLAERLTSNPFIGYVSGLLCALDIPSISLANLLLTETLFTLLLTLSLYFLVLYRIEGRKGNLIASAALMGSATLCRPIAVYLPFLLPFLLIGTGWRKIITSTLIYLIISFLVICPWLLRNKIVFGHPILSTIAYNNLLDYRAAGIYSIKNKISLEEAREELQQKLDHEFTADRVANPIEYKKKAAGLALEVIIGHPFIYLKNHLISVGNMLFKPLRSNIDIQFGLAKKGSALTSWGKQEKTSLLVRIRQQTSLVTIILVIIQLVLLIIMWLSFSYGLLICLFSKEYKVFGFLTLMLFYFALTSGGPEAYARFRVPLLTFLAIGSGYGLSCLWNRKAFQRETRC